MPPDAPPPPPPAPQRLTFSRRQRLGHAREYQRVYAAKASVTRGPMRVHARPNELGRTRLGLAVGKRVGSAVVRNHFKRLLREAFRLEQHALPPGFDLVISLAPHAPWALDRYRSNLRTALADLAQLWHRRQGNNPG